MLLGRPELDINLKSGAGSTPLTLACKQGHAEIAKLIMEKDPSAKPWMLSRF